MDDLQSDIFKDLCIVKAKKNAPQTLYNQFKRVLLKESNWRCYDSFKEALRNIHLKYRPTKLYRELLRELKPFHSVFTSGFITIRPLINYAQHIGVYAVKDIKHDQIITGLFGKITLKTYCSDSMVFVAKKDRLSRQVIRKITVVWRKMWS
jgi:hypothetical protein